jgi:hypothetical protein
MTRSHGPCGTNRLRECKTRIVETWTTERSVHLEAAGYASKPELVDMVPELLDRLAFAFTSEAPERHADEAAAWSGKEHGQQRARFDAYSLEEVVVEYRLLYEHTAAS